MSKVLLLFIGKVFCQIGDDSLSFHITYSVEVFQSLEKWNKTLTLLTVISEDIYTAGNNAIFHLSKDLNIKSLHLTNEEENIYKILAVSESLERLVTCSSGRARGCQLRNLNDVNKTYPSANVKFHANIVASGKFKTIGLIAPGILKDSSLYVARSIDLTGKDEGSCPLFERSLAESGHNDRETNTMSERVKSSFVIYYSDGFSYKGFVYFLASQREDASTTDSYVVPKLSRICQRARGEKFESFTELKITCRGGSGNLYSITQSAHLIGEDLFIVLNKYGDDPTQFDPQPQSALCIYNMEVINTAFQASIQACACEPPGSDLNSNNNYLGRARCGLFSKLVCKAYDLHSICSL
ncbi:Plexin-A3 [Holothuria leucospilota]|uniref:Plexin-A3 n=1 Tax=Holothuria leucospilota TaxID=206669 RepID=A0A9Q1CJ61_HOLLE|nr:Plexin-A3 [Holothuria leucospilota]